MHRNAAYNLKAHLSLYEASLVDEHNLPTKSVLEPERDDEVKQKMAVDERRDGFARVCNAHSSLVKTIRLGIRGS